MKGMLYRMQEFLAPQDGRAVIIDTSAGVVLGALPGLEDFSAGTAPVLPLADGLVVAPGQLTRLGAGTMQQAGLLMRMDWTNTLRAADFVLPVEEARHQVLFTAQDALDFGAVGMVTSFLLGYDEAIEAGCLKATVTLALAGKQLGLPLLVEVRPTGSRVSLYGKAVELGASYALEGGADGVVVPYPGPASLETIGKFVRIPWLLKPSRLDQAEYQLAEALACGCAGLWLDHTLFAQPRPEELVRTYRDRVHLPAAAGGAS